MRSAFVTNVALSLHVPKSDVSPKMDQLSASESTEHHKAHQALGTMLRQFVAAEQMPLGVVPLINRQYISIQTY